MSLRSIRRWLWCVTAVGAFGALTAAGLIGSAAAPLPDRPRISSIWPLSVIERLSGNRTFTHALSPLFTKSDRPDSLRRTFRPFVTAETENRDGGVTVDILPPLAKATRSGSERSFNLFPLVTHRTWTGDDGSRHQFTSVLPIYHRKVDGPQSHVAVFPFFMSGTAGSVSYPIPFKSAKPYRAVFPLYGNLYGAFGNDRVTFALWPLYTRIENHSSGAATDTDPFVKHQFLWPIVTVGRGGGTKSFKIWPLYGRTEKVGRYISQFVAWPIFNFTKNLAQEPENGKDIKAGLPIYWDIEEGHTKSKSLFPLYGKRTTPDRERSFKMWPLYIYTVYNKESYTTQDVLWPIFSRTKGRTTGYKFWPLFGVKRKQDFRSAAGSDGLKLEEDLSAFYFWTLGKYERNIRADGTRVYNRFFPLYIYGRSDDIHGYKQRQFFLWPIIAYQEDTLQGVKAVSFLNLLGTLEAQFPAIQEVYSPIWRVADYARQGDESRLSLLWNFIDVRKDGGRKAVSVGPILSWNKNADGMHEYTLLSALHIRNRGSMTHESVPAVPAAPAARTASAAR